MYLQNEKMAAQLWVFVNFSNKFLLENKIEQT